jgi:hypothetical protein
MASITYRKTRKGETITMRADKGEDLRNVLGPLATKSIAQLEREYRRCLAAEHRAIEAVPETPPRHTPTPTAKAAADRAWAAAAKTNAARAALQAARDAAMDDTKEQP